MHVAQGARRFGSRRASSEKRKAMTERSQIATSFLPLPGSAPVEWRDRARPDRLSRCAGRDGGARRGDPRRGRRRDWSGWSSIRRSTPPAPAPSIEDLIEPDRFPVFAAGRGGEYTYHGPGPAGRLCHARPEAAARGRARLRRRARSNGSSARLPPSTCAANGARTASASGWCGPTARPAGRLAGRGQDRRHRHPAAALGELSRHRHQCRAGPRPFRRHRAVRRARTTASPASSISACR